MIWSRMMLIHSTYLILEWFQRHFDRPKRILLTPHSIHSRRPERKPSPGVRVICLASSMIPFLKPLSRNGQLSKNFETACI
ncbi:hypothetical protein BDV18DRAFT_144588 [Aspergillus unguis]